MGFDFSSSVMGKQNHLISNIHIEKDDFYAKYWLLPIEYADAHAFSAKDLNQIRKLVEENQNLFLTKWHEFFSK